jgi:hypothetical protein
MDARSCAADGIRSYNKFSLSFAAAGAIGM